MRAQRRGHLITYQERLGVHHIKESDGETIGAREPVHMAGDSDDKDEAQVQPIAGGPSVDPWMALHRQAIRGSKNGPHRQAIRGCRAIHG